MSSLLAAGLAFCLTPGLAAWARRVGWIDQRSAHDAARKHRETPVPTVGGVALGLALVASAWVDGWSLPWIGLCLALGLGVWDDLRALPAGPKVLWQLLAGLGLALDSWREPAFAWGPWPLMVLAAVVAMNVVNTWDHADGLAAGCGALGASMALTPLSGACAGFWPWNTFLRYRRGTSPVPTAYLGDGGSHLLGLLCACYPATWPALWVPALDLCLVAIQRVRQGASPFEGDRRHLGHRLERLGWSPLQVALAAGACVAPAALMGGGARLFLGLGLSSLLYLALWIWSAARGEALDACDEQQTRR